MAANQPELISAHAISPHGRTPSTKAGLFVLGNVVNLKPIRPGLPPSGLVMIEYRGLSQYFAVGAIHLCLMGCSLLGVIQVPLSSSQCWFQRFGPFGVGFDSLSPLVRALLAPVPVLFAVACRWPLASGSQPLAVLTMTSYALGYHNYYIFSKVCWLWVCQNKPKLITGIIPKKSTSSRIALKSWRRCTNLISQG